MAYPGYVYQPYPKLIEDPSAHKGYVIVANEMEHKAYKEKKGPVVPEVKEVKKGTKLRFTEG